jgi:hypothetical protein
MAKSTVAFGVSFLHSTTTMVNQHSCNAMRLCGSRRAGMDDEYIVRMCNISLRSLAQAKRCQCLTGNAAKAVILG